ncbi:flagellar filament capping protein FliD [Chitinimonas sp. PSY-7]|uniref:flagellar filament capping protein FliD n=1 Tax=Chitinimonas sp. PSY-7 TaxID=3459088 RepID=UPI0040403C81
MSINTNAINGFVTSLTKNKNKQDEANAGDAGSFALQLAQFQPQNLNTLLNAAFDGTKSEDPLTAQSTAGIAGGMRNGLSADGRNLSLFDPESGYKMMSVIRQREVSYQAEFAALTEMKTELNDIQQEGEELAELTTSTDNSKIKAELSEFVDEYNAWVRQFDTEMKAGGALADSNAAKVSRYELDQRIESPFTGAQYGIRGMAELGLTIDPNTKLATLDTQKFDAVLAGNKVGAVETIRAFSGDFAKSAAMLNADNNFISNRLANLDRVIEYIGTNKTSLQAEFGLGDAPKVAGITQALASYKAVSRT